jgi:hypothetical protein
MSDCTPTTLPRSTLLSRFFSLFLRSDPAPDSEADLDRATRRATRCLSPHMLRDMGLRD